MKTKTKIASMVAAILASSLTIGTAQAQPIASAQSIATVQNFKIFFDSTNTQVSASDFAAPGGSLTNSSTEKATASVNATSSAPPQISSSTGQNLAINATVGTPTGSIALEQAANIPSPNPGTGATQSVLRAADVFPIPGNFAASSANEFGSPISGFSPLSTTPFAYNANEANLYNASWASLDNTSGTAGTVSNSGLTATFNFTGVAGVLRFDFNAGAYISAFLSNPDQVSAKSAYNITFDLVDSNGISVLDTTSNIFINALTGVYGISNNVARNGPGDGLIHDKSILGSTVDSTYTPTAGLTPGLIVPAALDGGFTLGVLAQSFKTTSLLATEDYTLTATINTDANVELKTIPEPELLALLGIGLLGMVVSSRKKFSFAA